MERLTFFFCVSLLMCAFFVGPSLMAEEAPSALVNFEIVNKINSKSIPKSLTGVAGDASRGEAIMINRRSGNCLSCHRVSVFDDKAKSDPSNYGDMGEIGPVLDGVASRYDMGELRLMLVDAKQFFPETIMPSFYHVRGLVRVSPDLQNKTILKAQEIEDVLSFLINLE